MPSAGAPATTTDWLITMDCDEQHEPASLPRFLRGDHAGRCGHHLGQPLPRPRTRRRRPAARPPEDQRHDHRLGQRPTRALHHRRVLRVQGLSRLDAEAAEARCRWLRDPAAAVGAGRRRRAPREGGSDPLDLQRPKPQLRRAAGRPGRAAAPLPAGLRAGTGEAP